MNRGLILAVLAPALGLAAIGLAELAPAGSAMAAPSPDAAPAVSVQAVQVEPVTLAETLTAVGTLTSPADTAVAPAIAGRIVALDISPGRIVPAGTILARLDDATEAAAYKAAAAGRATALAVFQHDEKLLPLGAVSAEQALSDASALDAAEADLAKAKAALDQTRIAAPFTGAVGFPEVSLGTEVQPGQTITRIVTLDPLLVRFTLPQQDMDAVRTGERVALAAAGLKGGAEGEITAVGRTLDPLSHTLRAEATVPNGGKNLRPGMFVSLRIVTGETSNVLMIPAEAVVPMGGATFVWCVGKDGHAVRKPVTLGRYQENKVQVLSGLRPGDEVIAAGQQRLEPGAALHVEPYRPVVNPDLAPVTAPLPAATDGSADGR